MGFHYSKIHLRVVGDSENVKEMPNFFETILLRDAIKLNKVRFRRWLVRFKITTGIRYFHLLKCCFQRSKENPAANLPTSHMLGIACFGTRLFEI